mgnify:CR=1 FL=1
MSPECGGLYNAWFMENAPRAFRESRERTGQEVAATLTATGNLTNLGPEVLRRSPKCLQTLRMCTCPPLARDRLVGLSGASKGLVSRMEIDGALPTGLPDGRLDAELRKLARTIERLVDTGIFFWLESVPLSRPTDADVARAATVVADRLCGALADPIIRNAQERRQLAGIGRWLDERGYRYLKTAKFDQMPAGTYGFRVNLPVVVADGSDEFVHIPVDVAVQPRGRRKNGLPVCIEAKSAGDFTNVNKRRKEEAQKMAQLRRTHGASIEYLLFLCGYFDGGYLGYEAAEGIDWVWEHRIDDLTECGL